MPLTTADADFIRELVRDRSAIVLDESKYYLIETRLEPLARERGTTGIEGLVAELRRRPAGGLDAEVVDALTTNETSWFRDRAPYDALRNDILPALLAARAATHRLTVWSAACSSGQEPYSIAMILRSHFPELAAWNVRIHATDLSTTMLAKARAGLYSQLEVNRGLPAAMLLAHFVREGTRFRVVPEIRSLVDFEPLNLIGSLAPVPVADVVFLRNVLIYFDAPTKGRILDAVADRMAPDGVLVLGAAESTLNSSDRFERVTGAPFGWYHLRGSRP